MHRMSQRQTLLVSVTFLATNFLAAVAIAQPPMIDAIASDQRHAHDPADSHRGGTHQGAQHHHGQVEVSAGQPIPKVNLVVHPDAQQGWNLEIQLTNFSFAPERVNAKGDTREGHAHLYVDQQKIARVYGSWYHLATLAPGKHTLRVTLNTNTHDQLMYQGKPIEATAVIVVPQTAGGTR